MRTLVQQFETLHSQITVQSTTGNKAKLTFQMIKLKHYHHVPLFFSSPRSEQLVCQFSAGRAKAHLWFQFRAAGLRGQAGQCPSGAGQMSAPLRLNAQWWLLRWCGGGHGGVVINISPGLIPLVHKQRFGAAVGTEHKGLWACEDNWAPQPLYYLRFVWPAGGVSPDEDRWAAHKGTEQQSRGMEELLALREIEAEIWGLEHGSGKRPKGTDSNWLGDSAALSEGNEAWGFLVLTYFGETE